MSTQLTDLHNRRANILHVARRAKEYGYPLLAWPEDKALLRVEDLPEIGGRVNVPRVWQGIQTMRTQVIANDAELRDFVREGYGYYRNSACQQFSAGSVLVVEVKFLY